MVLVALRESYADTLAAAEGADLLVSNLATLANRLVPENSGIPWAIPRLNEYWAAGIRHGSIAAVSG
jgi:hypothetical protein